MLLQIVALVSAVALYYILPEAYIHTGIKEFTTKSTTKNILCQNEVDRAKDLKLYIAKVVTRRFGCSS